MLRSLPEGTGKKNVREFFEENTSDEEKDSAHCSTCAFDSICRGETEMTKSNSQAGSCQNWKWEEQGWLGGSSQLVSG